MKIRDRYIVADGGRKLDTEADLFKSLDADEADLLKQHPHIDNDVWRGFLRFIPESAREQIAVQTFDRLRVLRDALQNTETPAWKAAVLAIKYQDMLMIYRQPITLDFLLPEIEVEAKSESGRNANQKRLEAYAKLEAFSIKLYERGKWRSPRDASFQLVEPVMKFARDNKLPELKKPQRRIYDWLLKHKKPT